MVISKYLYKDVIGILKQSGPIGNRNMGKENIDRIETKVKLGDLKSRRFNENTE